MKVTVPRQLPLNRIVVDEQNPLPGSKRLFRDPRVRQVDCENPQQMRGFDRLRDEVVKPLRERQRLMRPGHVSGEGENRDAAIRGEFPQSLEQLDAVHVREHEVLKHQIGRAAAHVFQGDLAGGSFEDLVVSLLERHPHQLERDRVVFDDENARPIHHDYPLWRGWSGLILIDSPHTADYRPNTTPA